MKLTCTIDTDELYDDEVSFETLLSDSLRRQIMVDCKDRLASEKFEEFAQLTSDTIVAQIKLKLENFLSEEIAIGGRWGEPTFVGSIEDLIKQRFDDVLLRPVDQSGKTLNGCTSSGKTWIEWMIEQKLEKTKKDSIESAARNVASQVQTAVNETIGELKNGAIKDQVNGVFADILGKKA